MSLDVAAAPGAAPRVDDPSAGPVSLLRLRGAVARLGATTIGPFDLRARAGERIAILGPSGAGKSTLLRLLSGELRPASGEARLGGMPLQDWRPGDLARRRAVLPQSHAVAFPMPVELVVSLGRIGREPDPAQGRIVAQALAAAQAGHLAGRRFDTLSGGEQARVQLARVLAQLWDVHDGAVMVDEPLAALDPGLQFELMDALQAQVRVRGHALVAVLHDLNQALSGFDRLWLLCGGRLQADLPAGRSAVPALEALYGIGLRCIAADDERVGVLPERPRRPDIRGDHLLPPSAVAAASPPDRSTHV